MALRDSDENEIKQGNGRRARSGAFVKSKVSLPPSSRINGKSLQT